MSNVDFTQMVTAAQKAQAKRAGLLEFLAHHRWKKEVGGIAWRDGLTLRTDREARASLEGVLAQWEVVPKRGPLLWKCANGWDQLDKRALRKAVRSVHRHVVLCFEAERQVAETIRDGSLTSASAVARAFETALTDLSTG